MDWKTESQRLLDERGLGLTSEQYIAGLRLALATLLREKAEAERRLAQVLNPVCESTGEPAVGGVCPRHGGDGCLVAGEVARLATTLAAVREAVDRVQAKLEEASEERYQNLKEWESVAARWKAEGDMYGWNFHMGMAAGANWCDIFYRRVLKEVRSLHDALTPAGVGAKEEA